MDVLAKSLSMTQLLAPSSQALVQLGLRGVYPGFPVEEMIFIGFQDLWLSDQTARYPDTIHIPQLPALEALRIEIFGNDISNCLVDVLFSIHSAPQLSSITFDLAWALGGKVLPYDTWHGIDGWLVWLARTGAREKNGLKAEMRLLSSWPAAEGCLRLFKEAGGEVRVTLA